MKNFIVIALAMIMLGCQMPNTNSTSTTTGGTLSITSVTTDTDSDRVLITLFDKDVSSTQSALNYTFKDSTGNILTPATGGNGLTTAGNPVAVPVRDSTNLKKVVITLGTSSQDDRALPAGTYQLTISGVTAVDGSTMSSTSTTFTVVDKTRPTLFSAYTFSNGVNFFASHQRIILKFSEPMKVDSSPYNNISNFKVDIGDGIWKKLSDISGLTLVLSDNNKTFKITFPSTITLTTSSKFMIGYTEGSATYVPQDASGNYFKGDAIGSIISLSGIIPAIVSTSIISATLEVTAVNTLKATFPRGIESIDPSEFTIKNAVNSAITPTAATIDPTNSAVVTFTIPSGGANEFTPNDTAVVLAANNVFLTSKDFLGIPIQGNNVLASSNSNDIGVTLKSAAIKDANTLLLNFDGLVAAGQESKIVSNLIASQTVGTTTTTWTSSSGLTCGLIPATGSSVIKLTTSSAMSLIDPVTIKTTSSTSAVGVNGAKISTNTTGLQNASFVAISLTEGLRPNSSNLSGKVSIIGNENNAFVVQFNKSIDPLSLTGVWTTSDNVLYTLTGAAVTYDGASDKVTVANVGEFKFSDLYIGIGNNSTSGTATVVLDKSTTGGDTMRITLTSYPSLYVYFIVDPTSMTCSITYTPLSSFQTPVGTAIASGYHPVVLTN